MCISNHVPIWVTPTSPQCTHCLENREPYRFCGKKRLCFVRSCLLTVLTMMLLVGWWKTLWLFGCLVFRDCKSGEVLVSKPARETWLGADGWMEVTAPLWHRYTRMGFGELRRPEPSVLSRQWNFCHSVWGTMNGWNRPFVDRNGDLTKHKT